MSAFERSILINSHKFFCKIRIFCFIRLILRKKVKNIFTICEISLKLHLITLKMPLVYLSLGSNIGKNMKDIAKNLAAACVFLEEKVGKIILKSKIYQTKAWGVQNQADFCNQIILISTNLVPEMLLNVLLAIELSLGRVRKVRWGERIIDIDIIYFDDLIINDTFGENLLIIPHPRMQERLFVLVPLAEIAPYFVHPILKKTNKQLLSICNDDLEVMIYDKT